MVAQIVHRLLSELLQLVLHLIKVFLLVLSNWIDILAKRAQLFYLLDLALDDVDHFLQVFEVRVNLGLLLQHIIKTTMSKQSR